MFWLKQFQKAKILKLESFTIKHMLAQPDDEKTITKHFL